MLEATRQFPDRQRHLVHRAQIRIHSLACIEPGFLAGMRREGFPLLLVNGSRIYECAGNDSSAQSIAKAVRHCVKNGDVALDGRSTWNRPEVWHTARERSRDGEPARIGVILHVVLR